MVNMDSIKEARKGLESKLESTKAQLHASQDTLAAVVLEKQRLVNENMEMKAVCEELMSHLEQSADHVQMTDSEDKKRKSSEAS